LYYQWSKEEFIMAYRELNKELKFDRNNFFSSQNISLDSRIILEQSISSFVLFLEIAYSGSFFSPYGEGDKNDSVLLNEVISKVPFIS
jgi:hypothetical protein